MEVREVSRWEAVEDLAAAWEPLLARSPTPTVFLSLEWLGAWWAAYGAGFRLRLLVAEEAGRVVGVAPLCQRDAHYGPIRLRRVQLIGEPRADYNDWLVPDGRADVYAAFLAHLAARRDWDALVLADVPEESPLAAGWEAAARNVRLWAGRAASYACPTARLREGALDRADRKKRKWSRLEALGPLQLRAAETVEAGRAWLPGFFAQHRDRWRRPGAGGMFDHDDHRRFYLAQWERLAPAGRADFVRLEAGGRTVAWHFGLVDRDRLLYYKPAFDPALAADSPGHALIAFLLRRAAARGLSELDFTRGDERHKRLYATAVRRNVVLRAYRGAWGRVAGAAAIWRGGGEVR